MWKHGKLIFRKRKAQHDSQSYVPKQRLGSDAGSSQSSLGSQVSNGSVDGTFTALEELITANIETFPKKRARSPEWREYLQHLHALRDTVAKHKLTVNQPNHTRDAELVVLYHDIKLEIQSATNNARPVTIYDSVAIAAGTHHCQELLILKERFTACMVASPNSTATASTGPDTNFPNSPEERRSLDQISAEIADYPATIEPHDGVHICKCCPQPKTFTSEAAVMLHGILTSTAQRSATGVGRETYRCDYFGCMSRFEDPVLLQKHESESHGLEHGLFATAAAVWSGGGVTSSFLTRQAWPRRCDRVNPDTGRPCNATFCRPYDLKRHDFATHKIHDLMERDALQRVCQAMM